MEKFRGNDIEFINGEPVYSDTKESVPDTWMKRPCGNCGLHFTEEGHDGCLGTLPGVMNACCGHGNINEAYIQYWDGLRIDKEEAIAEMKELKRN